MKIDNILVQFPVEQLHDAVGHLLHRVVEDAFVDAVRHHAAGKYDEQDDADDGSRADASQRQGPERQPVAGRPEPEQRTQSQDHEDDQRGVADQRQAQPDGFALEFVAVDDADDVERLQRTAFLGVPFGITAVDVRDERVDEHAQIDVSDAHRFHEGFAAVPLWRRTRRSGIGR